MKSLHPTWPAERPIVIAGAPLAKLTMQQIRELLLRDVETLAAGGVHGLMMENFGDVPFFPGAVPPHVIAQMTALACSVRAATILPLGINVLRNDGRAALAIAHAADADFIRVNVLCGARVADQGLLQGIAHDLLRDQVLLGATSVKIFADVDVKHSAPLAERPLEDEVSDLVERGRADAVVVSGAGTGKATDPAKAQRAKRAAPETPVFIGSGITAETIAQFRDSADGFIVGTALKENGTATNPVQLTRVRALMAALG
ncbi:BtpA/SgcQ family protein [soil metagenome]